MSLPIHVEFASSSALRRKLRLGTCLTGAAAALFLGTAPVRAAPAHPFTPVTLDRLAPSRPAAAKAAPQDLTIAVPEGTVIETDGYGLGGITANEPTGGITISASGTSVTTLGERSNGIGAVAYNGDLTIHAGDVSTAGYLSRGIFADSNTGNIAIDANSVTTSGNLSTAIVGHTVYGDVAITAGYVGTSGYGSEGIYAASSQGSATVHAGDVRVNGPVSRGIVVYSAGTTTITADNVHTGIGYGPESTSRGIVAAGTAINIDVSGSVTTSGDYSTGIFARTNLVYSDPTVVPDISVSAGSVSTNGAYSHGIMALNYSDTGKIAVSAGTVTTGGPQSVGIYAGGNGDISITADTVKTTGAGSLGIGAKSYGGDIAISAGSVTTSGTGSTGISAFNYAPTGNTTVSAGSVATSRDYSADIIAEGFGNVSVDAGALSTTGFQSAGVVAYSVSGNVSVNVGTIKTAGGIGTGIAAYAFGQTSHIDIKADSIQTGGTLSQGLELISLGDATVNIGSITTSGAASDAININTNHYDYQANGKPLDTVVNVGDIVTTGTGSRGIIVQTYGNLEITAGTIETSGNRYSQGHNTFFAEGIATTGVDGNTSITVGSIKTAGDGAVGIDSSQFLGDLAIKAGTVTTTGAHAPAILARVTYGNATIDAGTVTTSGDFSSGIVATAGGYSPDKQSTVTISAGTVSTGGKNAYGIRAGAYGDVSVAVGSVATTGDGSHGIVAQSVYDDATIQAGSVTTSGAGASAIAAIAAYGTATIVAGDVSTTGAYVPGDAYYGVPGIAADAVYAVGNAVSITTTGKVSTLGDHARGITAIGLGDGDVTIKASGPITTQGDGAYGVFASSYAGHVDVTTDAITTKGDNAPALIAYSSYGTASVKAGAIATSGSGSVGAFVGGGSGADVTIASITTSGDNATGLIVHSGSQDTIGDVTAKVGSVATTGNYAAGISISSGGAAALEVNSVATTGYYSTGIFSSSALGSNRITAGSVTTSGDKAIGIYAGSYRGDLTITAGDIATKGDNAQGIRSESVQGGTAITVTGKIQTAGYFSQGIFATSVGGDTVIHNGGSIVTTGTYSAGIRSNAADGATIIDGGKITTTGDRSIGIDVFAVGTLKSIDVTADSVTTSGNGATGINLVNPDDGVITYGNVLAAASAKSAIVADSDISLKSGTVRTGGEDANAIQIFGVGNVTVDATNTIAAKSTAMLIQARDQANVTIRGTTSGGASDAVLIAGADVHVATTASGSITGPVNGLVIDAVGPYIPPVQDPYGPVFLSSAATTGGTATVDNAGSIAGGSGYAILVESGRALVNNSGNISGAIAFGSGDDILTNSGTFVATKDSDFGAGSDSFVNTGTLLVSGGKTPVAVTFTGLESFQNKGGLVELRNGVVGDTLTLPGSYVGSAGAKLGLDIAANGSAADKLVIGGAATGHSDIVLNVDGTSATLLAKPLTLVQAGAGTNADAFGVANPDIGFIHYGLSYNAASHAFGLATQAGAPIYRMLAIPRASEAIWHRAADAWEAHMAEKRDARTAGDDGFGQRLWGQIYGGVDTLDSHRSLGGERIDTGTRQDYYGAQFGLDLAGKTNDNGGMLFGVTASYLSSTLNGQGTGDRTKFDTVALGGYASVLAGPIFVNGLVQYSHDWIAASNPVLRWSDKLKGDSYGGQLQVGARVGHDRLYIEPAASLAYVRSDIGDLQALGQTVDFDKRDGLRGKLGARLGGLIDIAGGGKATFYVQANYVHEFKGENGLTFLSGGTSATVRGVRPPDYGQGAVGVNIFSSGRASGFIEGDADVGGGVKGGGGRAGITFKL